MGTDTDVGKTFVAARLIRALAKRGNNVGVMKPFETGVRSSRRRSRAPSDIELLLSAADKSADDLSLISPYRFNEPLAPAIAAERAGVNISVAHVARCFRTLAKRHSHLVIEGAGGVYSPLGPRGLNAASLARRLGVPAILVAANRLGALSHVLLAREALSQHRVAVKAVVLTEPTPAPRLVRETNLAALPFAILADAHLETKLIKALGW